LRSGETATLQRRRFLTWSLLILFFGGLAGIRTTRVAAEQSSSITVSAAISLKDSLDEAGHLDATQHLAAKVAFNYGGSGSLERQIEQGASVDVFFQPLKNRWTTLTRRDGWRPRRGETIVYPAAVLKNSKNAAAAREFVGFLEGPEARAAFEKYGFAPAEKSAVKN